MRKKYTIPEMELVVFKCEDIVTGSNESPFVPFNVDEVNELPEIE